METAATSSAELRPPVGGRPGAGERQRRPHAARPCSRKPVSGHLGESQPPRPLGWGGKRAPKISQGTLIALLCPLTNGGARQSQEGKAAGRFRGARGVRHVRGGVIGGRGFTPGSPHLPGLPRLQTASRSPLLPPPPAQPGRQVAKFAMGLGVGEAVGSSWCY